MRPVRRSCKLVVGLSVMAGAIGVAGANPAQARFPDCQVIDCVKPEVPVVKLKFKWPVPDPGCLTCPPIVRDPLTEIVLPQIEKMQILDLPTLSSFQVKDPVQRP